VTLANWVPFGFASSSSTTELEGYIPQPHESMDIQNAIVGPDYLRTMQIPVVSGREFTLQDTARTVPVALVNQALADHYWPHQYPIGKRLHIHENWFSIIGIARNTKYNDLSEAPQPFIYLPVFQDYYPGAIIHARVSGDPLVFAATIEKTVHELNPELPVYDVTTLRSRVQIASTGERIAGTFVGLFGLLALVLAGVGIYGVIALTTRQRTHEIGIRIALGAQKRNVFGLVLNQGLRLTLIGIGIGVALAFTLTRFLGSMLFGVTPTDVLTFIAVVILLLIVALAACYVPAHRAAGIDPIVALRHE
jgi:predicted permease